MIKIFPGLSLVAWHGMVPDMPKDKPVCNVYAVRFRDFLVLIDCGPAHSLPWVLKNLRLLGFSSADVKFVLLTHPHLDHCGAGHLLQQGGTQLVASEYTAMVMEKEPRQVLYEDPSQVVPTRVDLTLGKEGNLDLDGCGPATDPGARGTGVRRYR